MGQTPYIILFACGLIFINSIKVNSVSGTQIQSDETELLDGTEESAESSSNINPILEQTESQADGKRTKRQIIKISSNAAKVKLVQPPLSLRHNRAPQQFTRYPTVYRGGFPRRPPMKKSRKEYDSYAEESSYDPKKVKRNLRKSTTKDFRAGEYFRDEDQECDREEGKHLKKHHRSVVKIKRKKPKPNVLGEYLANYEGDDLLSHEELLRHESTKLRYVGTEDTRPFHGYDPAGSSIHMRQVPAPNLFPQSTPDTIKEQFYDENYVPALKIKNLPKNGRQVQSLFSQQYTSHNPHVTTNFGLAEALQPNFIQYGVKGSYVGSAPFRFPHSEKDSQLVEASSNHYVTAVPVKTPGIQVIQPPQFSDAAPSHPSNPSRLMSSSASQPEETTGQRATIKDILEEDCPSYDTKGYCDSPPRYPMQQIKSMMKKCANLMEVMIPKPFEDSQELYGFAKRSDNPEEKTNNTVAEEEKSDNSSSTWSRSSNDGRTICNSDLELTEPGYAREVNSGKWFVIVQHPDTAMQRIETDTCRYPGKPCGALTELKCSKINVFSNKATRCLQHYTNQRLISWDPESPEECPRLRMFRFPSACLCHLGNV